MGQKNCNEQWLDGYFQAQKDCENFMKSFQVFEKET